MSTERIGVSKVETIVNEMGLIFREQTIGDYGIDAQIETYADDGYASGELIAVQIKSGSSYANKKNRNGDIEYYIEDKHYKYWLNHSLPVIIVIYDPESGICFWEVINHSTVHETPKGRKVEIPHTHNFANAKKELSKIAANTSKFNNLILAKPWMQKIKSGKEIKLYAEEMINKSLGQGKLELKVIENGESKILLKWDMITMGFRSYEEIIKKLFPWAKFSVDEIEYSEGSLEYQQYCDKCGTYCTDKEYLEENGIEGNYIFENAPSFEEWRAEENLPDIRPYQNDGEGEYYLLNVELNEIGESFMTIDNFLESNEYFKNEQIY